jgi:hypothetical protein
MDIHSSPVVEGVEVHEFGRLTEKIGVGGLTLNVSGFLNDECNSKRASITLNMLITHLQGGNFYFMVITLPRP